MKKINRKLYALIFWRTPIGEILNKVYDLKIHFKYSFSPQKNTKKKQLYAYLQKQFHVIEKGMALPVPRPGFGKEKILDILHNAEFYINQFGHDKLIDALVATLKDYMNFNIQEGEDVSSEYYKKITSFIDKYPEKIKIGGIKKITKDTIKKAIDIDFEKFIKTRVSVRDFDDKAVPVELVDKAISIAKYAPSVCNRQGWKAHLYTDKTKIKELLSLQNGNRGFTGSINKLIIITGDTTAFTKYEANQIFTDGGLFAMNLILSLHSLGIGSIALNTDIPYLTEKKMKITGNIPENERLIMYLGIGFLKDEFRAAYSERKENDQILEVHEK